MGGMGTKGSPTSVEVCFETGLQMNDAEMPALFPGDFAENDLRGRQVEPVRGKNIGKAG